MTRLVRNPPAKLAAAGALALGTIGVAAFAAAPSANVTPKTEAPAEARVLSRAFAGVAKALRPSVVRIDVEMARANTIKKNVLPKGFEAPKGFEHFFQWDEGEGPGLPMPGPMGGTGSGVVMDADGHIVTNRHVVDGASKVTVTLHDGREYKARVVGADPRTDVAVVKLESPPKDLVAARMGDSEKIEVGEWVLAIGSPLGMDQTVTAGIVSGKGRAGQGRGGHLVRMSGDRVRSYIQTDAKINPGNSGGPLCNLEGEVVGVNTLINGGPGGSYGFAIPIGEVRRVAQILMKDGRVRYAYLGVHLGDPRDVSVREWERMAKDAPPQGAYVSEVVPGGPAAKAGMLVGDVITGIEGQKVSGPQDVIDTVTARGVGAAVSVDYLREGKAARLKATLGEFPKEPEARAGR